MIINASITYLITKIKRKKANIIGVSKFDKQAGDRRYDSAYPALNSPAGLRILLSDYHALKNRQYAGDYDATIILADLATAIKAAQLTGRQSEAMRLVYEEDLTQEDAGRAMGVAQNTLSETVERALENIADVYWYWSSHGEGYSLLDETEAK